MAKRTLFLIVFISLSTDLFAQAPAWLWAASGKDRGSNLGGGDIAIDRSGSIYVTGEFTDTLILENQTLVSMGGKDVYIAKYKPSGQLIWVKSGGGISEDRGPGVALDNGGNVYIAGSFGNQAHFDHLSITSQGQHDIFLGKYDPDGNLVWLKSFGGPATESVSANSGRGFFIDAYNQLYITGSFRETANFDGTSITSKGGQDVYIAKLDSAGNVRWAKSAGSSSTDFGSDVCVDQAGNVFITGTHGGTISFDTIKLTEKKFGDIFIAKYDSLGNVLWAKTAGGDLPDFGSALVCDESMNVYVLGEFNSSKLFFGSTIVSNRGFYDVFLAKYNAGGDLIWAKSAGWAGAESGHDITFWNNELYISGSFVQGIIFNNDTLWSHQGNGGEDGFIAKYNEQGVFKWARNAGGFASDRLVGIALDPNGFPVVTGRVNSPSALFGNSTVEGPNAPFIAKLGLFPENVVELENDQFSIYPNPTTGTLQISTDKGVAIREVSIRDMQGRLVREYSNLERGSLDVSELPQGMYLLYLDSDQGRVLHRFLKDSAD